MLEFNSVSPGIFQWLLSQVIQVLKHKYSLDICYVNKDTN